MELYVLSSMSPTTCYLHKPGFVSFKMYDDSPGNGRNKLLLLPTCAVDNIRNPTGTFKSISEFVIDPTTYSLENNIIKREGNQDISRFQYLKEEIVDHYFVGTRAEHAPRFFEDGASAL